jgi:hypothetical protein
MPEDSDYSDLQELPELEHSDSEDTNLELKPREELEQEEPQLEELDLTN